MRLAFHENNNGFMYNATETYFHGGEYNSTLATRYYTVDRVFTLEMHYICIRIRLRRQPGASVPIII